MYNFMKLFETKKNTTELNGFTTFAMTLPVTNKLKEFFHRKILYGNFFNLYVNIERSAVRVYKRRFSTEKKNLCYNWKK